MKSKVFIFNEVCPGGNYGIGTYIEQVKNSLSNNPTIETHVIHLRHQSQEFIVKKDNKNNKTFFVPDKLPYLIKNNEKYYRNVFFLFCNLLENKEKYVILFNYFNHGYLMDLIKRKFPKIKIIFTVHFFNWTFSIKGNSSYFKQIINADKNQLKDNIEKQVHKSFEKDLYVFNNADVIFCLSDYAKKLLISEYKINDHKIILINNGLQDEAPNLSNKEKDSLRAQLLFDKNEKIILYVGRLDCNKGGSELLQAFKQLLTMMPNCKLIIVGNGLYNFYFEQSAEIWSKIIFTGRIKKEQVYKFYQIADVGVLPSYSEQCSYVAIEMMMHGVPIIGTTSTGLSEMIIDGYNGCKINLIEKGNNVFFNTDELVFKLFDILTADESRIKKIRVNSRKMFEDDYNVEMMKEKFVRALTIRE